MLFNTLKKRLVVSIAAGTILTLGCLALVSYDTIISIQSNRLSASIESELRQISDQMQKDYLSLIQISQNLTPEGMVGMELEEYFQSDQPYDRSVISRNVSERIGLVAFTNMNTEIITYYDPNSKEPFFSNLPLENDFDPELIPVLAHNPEVDYLAMHESASRSSGRSVLSLLRRIAVYDERELLIYAELKNSLPESLHELSESQKVRYYFVQCDANGIIRYTNTPQTFQLGESISLSASKTSGFTKDFFWCRSSLPLEFDNFIFIPIQDYNKELYSWQFKTVLVIFITFVTMCALAVMLWRLIYRPLKLFGEEMEAVGGGDLSLTERQMGIVEFDELFSRFEHMKLQIEDLMVENEKKEKNRHRLEIEKIYYQINPHFLMNTLNSIRWMAAMDGNKDIDSFVSQLSYILKYSLEKTDRRATLNTEIKMLEAYLELQKKRYCFRSEINVEPGDYLEQPVARLILQPLAENAVCHGIDENGLIKISIRPVESEIEIVMEDDGIGFDMEGADEDRMNNQAQFLGKGIGLRYVRLTLQDFYGERARMEIKSATGRGTVVKICLPLDGKQSGEQESGGWSDEKRE